MAYYSGMRMGEVFSLSWDRVNWKEGQLYLRAQDTKTDTPRVLYLTEDALRVLTAWRQRCELQWPQCPWICHRGGRQLESIKHSWRKACERVGLGKMVEVEGANTKVWVGKIPHDLRQTAARKFLTDFVRRAYRRPAASTDVDKLAHYVDLAQSQGQTFQQGIEYAMTAAMCSPKFLFRIETDIPGITAAVKTTAKAT